MTFLKKQHLVIMGIVYFFSMQSSLFSQQEMFDDFNYSSSSDAALYNINKWIVVNGESGPPSGGIYDKNNISFYSDPQSPGNMLMGVSTTATNKSSETRHSRIETAEMPYLYGTYASLIYLDDTPAEFGDGNVETFYTIGNYSTCNQAHLYSEVDFEYLPYDLWGNKDKVLYMTSWETCELGDRDYTSLKQSFSGWHTFMYTYVQGQPVKFYMDGELIATLKGSYPDSYQNISFANWIVDNVVGDSKELRNTTMQVDWVYYAKDEVLSMDQVEEKVNSFRENNVTRKNLSGQQATTRKQTKNLRANDEETDIALPTEGYYLNRPAISSLADNHVDVDNSRSSGPIVSGEMTYYGPTSGNITDVPSNAGGYTSDDLQSYGMDFCAMQTTNLMNDQLMGGCIEITSPSGNKGKFLIVDKLPSGSAGDVDIYGKETFAKLEDPDLGRVNVQWKIVALPTSENVQYRFQSGSNAWWAALQVFKHKYPLAKVEYLNGSGTYIEMTRQSDGGNFFIASGMGDGPYTIRLTDYFGNVLVHNGVLMQSSYRQDASSNFKTTNQAVQPLLDTQQDFLLDIFPNPVHSTANIIYQTLGSSKVNLTVYTLEGKKITTLQNKTVNTGTHKVTADFSDFSNGIYFIRLVSGDKTQTTRFVVSK